VVIELAITVFIGLSGLGQWTVRYAAVLTVLYLVRAAIGDLLLADPADPRAGETEGRMASLLGLVLMIGFISLLAFSAAAALTGDPSWLVVGLTIPLALAQDLLRYISFWTLHPKTAAILDLVWLLTSLVGIGVIATTRSVTVGIAFWGLGALISAVTGMVLTGIWPRSPRAGLVWWTSNRRLGVPTFLDTALYLLGNQGLWFLIAAVAGAQTLGVFRLALLLANPALLVYLATQTTLVPTITREGVTTAHLLRYTAMASAVGISLFAIAAAIVLPLLRHTGAITAPTPASLIWLTVAYVVASAPYVITASLLRAKRHGSGFLLMRATSTAITIAVAVVWISTWGANAAMAGSAAGTLCAALLGIRLATTWLREPASTA
jgi:O-antigen/teichoic acid export membrane protein